MSRENYGATWWGREWLRSLEGIDYENRIPRGKSYARAGMVRKLTIKENMITASVQGTRRTPYRVMIVVPPFFEEETDRLVDALLQRPLIVGKLLNRELDPAVLDIAEQCGLRVFPRQWSDIKLQCSCPDWAVPCKHLAAVIYKVSREIDNNPFLVFEMHRVNLIDELKKRGVKIEKSRAIDIPSYTTSLTQPAQAAVATSREGLAKRINYSLLEDIGQLLMNMLQDNPAFCAEGDFKLQYADCLKRATKKAQRLLDKKVGLAAMLDVAEPFGITRHSDVRLHIDEQLRCRVMVTDTASGERDEVSLADALVGVNELHPDFLADYQPSVQALYGALMCATHLLMHGAVTPRIVRLGKLHAIDWQAARLDPRVRRVMEQVEGLFAQGEVAYLPSNRKRATAVSCAGDVAVSQVLRLLIGAAADTAANDSSLLMMFFAGELKAFDRVGEHETPGGIKSWLEPYRMETDNNVPLFVVNEDGTGDFTLDIAIEREFEDHTTTSSTLAEVAVSPAFEPKRIDIYKKLSLLSTLLNGAIDDYVNSNGEATIHYDLKTIVPFLFESLPVIRLMGVHVLMPKRLQQILRPKASAFISANSQNSPQFMRLDQMLQFDWRVALGDNIIDIKEFEQLVSQASGLIVYKGHYFMVDPQDITRMYKQMNAKPMSSAQLLQTALSGTLGDAPVAMSADANRLIEQLKHPQPVSLPSQLNATLRPYQERGYEWMYRNMQLGFGSIIADDMGLGKTLQVITLIARLAEDGELKKEHVLIVVPTGLINNWVQEFARFAPQVTTHVHHGSSRDLNTFAAQVLITSYGILRSDVQKLCKLKWRLMVIDEAQNIKNDSTGQSIAARSVKAGGYIAMSGTPVENRLSEYWTIMDYVNKGYLGTRKQFDNEYAKPIQLWGDEAMADRFRKVTAPFMMRRLKSDRTIINDLPDKIEQNDYAQLTAPQAALYESTLREGMLAIESVDGNSPQQLFKRQGLVLQMMLALKQICNHPAQFLKRGSRDAGQSGKSEMLLDLVDSIVQCGEKVLIFTQFTEMGGLLQEMIKKRIGTEPMFFHGGCSLKLRNAIVERFQNNRADQVLILSLRAAGTGLNLTAATHVIHYDLWWNPAVEAQATDRAYRIGQHRNVMVHRFITQDTFEERIDKMIQSKKNLAQLTVEAGENWIGHLSNSEIRELFER